MRTIEFKIVACESNGYCTDTQTIQIFTERDSIEPEDQKGKSDIGYDDIGGCRRQLGLIREMVELLLRHPSYFQIWELNHLEEF
jgi:transitional endoplasmic reticulum ATPase